MSKPHKRDMTKGEIVPHMLRMTWPMTIGIGAIISVSLVDTYFISRIGTDELAAISYTFPIVTLMFNIIFGMAIAMSAVISRKVGAQKFDEVKQITMIGLAMVVILTLALVVLTFAFAETLFAAMGAGQRMQSLIMDYMSIWLLGATFLSIPVVADSAIRGMGDPISPAIVMLSVALTNFILDPIFIFGWFGFPAMGLQGAAIASVTAYVVGMVAALWILGAREKLITLAPLVNKLCWSNGFKALAVIAIPVGIANAITPIVSYGYTAILSNIGHEAVAGFGVATRLEAFALIPIMALAGGVAALIGQNYGAGLFDRVNTALRLSIKFALFYGIGCAIILAILATPVANLFTDNASTYDFIKSYLLYIPISFVGLNIFLVVTASMNAMERPKTALGLNLMRSFILALPLAYILTITQMTEGFLWSIVITNAISMGMALICMKRLDCFKRLKSIS